MAPSPEPKTIDSQEARGKAVPSEPLSKYAVYQSEMAADVTTCVEALSCQPILFIGSGLARRYLNAPSWDELLSYLADRCPLVDKPLAYFKQTLGSAPAIGQAFARLYQEWAWSSGRSEFPDELFVEGISQTAYIKHAITQRLIELTPSSLDDIKSATLRKEIAALQAIRPHAIITTNYDQMIELIFPEYLPIVGQEIIRGQSMSVGELFKIHGCVSRPDSLVFTQDDYDDFARKKKYLSAKLLTFFSEHALIFIGYSANDANIQAILTDIDEALPETGGVIDNVYILEWRPQIGPSETPARERLIAIGGTKGVRIKSIAATDFVWPFEALGTHNFNPKVKDFVDAGLPSGAVFAEFC